MSEEAQNLNMPKYDELIISSSPHIQTPEKVNTIMLKVLIALLPVGIASVYFFGMNALKVIIYTSIFSVLAEALWCFIEKKNIKETIFDGSALVTGVILAFNFSAMTPWYVCLIGAFLAIWLGKQVFGGLGCNPFNPALVARVGLLIALPGLMTTWCPTIQMQESANLSYTQSMYNQKIDATTSATPLGIIANIPKDTSIGSNSSLFCNIDNKTSLWNYFIGNVPGCIGETSTLAILIGMLLLLFWKLINWRVPIFYVGTVFIFTGIINFFFPGVTPSPMFHILTGGLMFGAIFMATDMVTSPLTNSGAIIFAIGCGLVTCVIRIWGNNPEGVSFAILFMNAFVPLIDKFCTRKPFGFQKRKVA